jgi:leader peptidase (prepilin peptidase)/N-methyltransferase
LNANRFSDHYRIKNGIASSLKSGILDQSSYTEAIMDFFCGLYEHELVAIIAITTIALCIGSFLGVVVHRLPIMLERNGRQSSEIFNLWLPFSFCPHCKVTLRFREMIPIFSYLFLRGKCHSCQSKISLHYFLIECSTVILTLLLYKYFGLSIYFLLGAILLWSLITLTFIDLNTFLLPNRITIPLLILGLITNSFSIFVAFREALLGAIFSYLLFNVLAWIFYKTRKIEALGRGDFKLVAVLGAWFGLGMIPGIILIASLTGFVIGLIYIIAAKQSVTSRIPFGPFLGLAGALALFWTGTLYQHKQHLARLLW